MTLLDRFPKLLNASVRCHSPGLARFPKSATASRMSLRISRRGVATAAQPPNSQFSQLTYAQRYRKQKSENIMTVVNYTASVIVVFIGLAYAAVPLYKIICTQTGLDGTPLTAAGSKYDPSTMKPVPGARKLKIKFDASVSDKMRWQFTPVTRQIKVVPGETALAFYTAKNSSAEDIVGISTYSVVPPKAAQYFNKIQCFCFEEQKLEAGEEVDMPVFFYIDPEFLEDPWMSDVNEITLSYTFFKSKAQ
ncbi:cytochrome c oxidase assembly protein CtaG/Cox11-domain-containing protein [Cladochytrium replicatum]|nr:cytochrome c oxidase assembly protein CtaG/Cox11-domain-containing protein [Cladochytrium replicatum]